MLVFGLGPPWPRLQFPADANHVFRMPPSYVTKQLRFIGAQNIPAPRPSKLKSPTASLNISAGGRITPVYHPLRRGGRRSGQRNCFLRDGGQRALVHLGDWFNTHDHRRLDCRLGGVQLDGSQPLNSMKPLSQTKLFNQDFGLTIPAAR